MYCEGGGVSSATRTHAIPLIKSSTTLGLIRLFCLALPLVQVLVERSVQWPKEQNSNEEKNLLKY